MFENPNQHQEQQVKKNNTGKESIVTMPHLNELYRQEYKPHENKTGKCKFSGYLMLIDDGYREGG